MPADTEAQTTIGTVEVREGGEDGPFINSTDIATYFNRARCECGERATITLRIQLNVTNPGNNEKYRFVIGNDCLLNNDIDNTKVENGTCAAIGDPKLLRDLPTNNVAVVTLPIATLMFGECERENASFAFQLWVGQEGQYQNVPLPDNTFASYAVDGTAPEAPVKNGDPKAGEGLISVSFDPGADNLSDAFYQLLCAKVVDGQEQPWSDSEREAFFDTAALICPLTDETTNTSFPLPAQTNDGGVEDAQVDELTDAGIVSDGGDASGQVDGGTTVLSNSGLLGDRRYICSDRLSSTNATISGLENGQLYRVYAIAVDLFGNYTDPLLLGSATPSFTEDLYERYRRAGGRASGYCQQTGDPQVGSWGLMSFLVFAWFVRRRYVVPRIADRLSYGKRLRTMLLPTLVALGTVGDAHALGGVEADLSDEQSFRSAQHFAWEIKFGPYSPNIDTEFDNATPYADLFGDGVGLMVRTEFDWQIWRGFGNNVGVGLDLGYYTNSADSCPDDGDSTSGALASCQERVDGDTTSVTLLPIALLAVYRFDLLADRWHIPLVPYAKIGFNYTFWWIRKGDGAVARFGDDKAKGGTWGWQLSVGGAVRLDAFEPGAAKALDNGFGINHTLIFAELLHVQADGLGSSSALHVGDTTFMAGLGFEF